MTNSTDPETAAIFEFRSAAIADRNYLNVAICDRAIDGLIPYSVCRVMTEDQFSVVGPMTQREARKRCRAMMAAGSAPSRLTVF